MSGYHVSLCPVKAKRGKANRGPARGLIAELPVTRVLGEITPKAYSAPVPEIGCQTGTRATSFASV